MEDSRSFCCPFRGTFAASTTSVGPQRPPLPPRILEGPQLCLQRSVEVRGGPRRSVGVRGDQRESMEVCGVPRWSTGATEVLGASKKI